jgi:starch-binding outer membrane protein, SusD/RagB family
MKNKIYIILGILLSLFVSLSCDLLEEEVVSGVTPEFYTTPEGLKSAINAAYEPLRRYYADEQGMSMTVFGTDEFTNGGHGSYRYMNQYSTQLNSQSSPLWNIWYHFYVGINTCNTAIARSEGLEMNSDVKNSMLGEVRFLRAHYYFELVRHFGPIHLSLEETIGVETEANRTPENEIYTAIIEDLEFAISNLPIKQNEFGRITRPAAEHMLSLVLLTRGYKDFAEANDFSRSAELATNVIKNYEHRLLDHFLDVFNHDNETNDEIIWSVQYEQDILINGLGNRSHMYFAPWFSFYSGLDDSNEPGYGRPWIRYRPTQWGLDNFRPLDIDARFLSTFQSVWYYNSPGTIPEGSAVGDTAIWVTHEYLTQEKYDEVMERHPNLIFYSWHPDNIGDPWGFENVINLFPYPEKKFSDYKRDGAWVTAGTRDWIVYRVAETYFILAEALLQDGRASDAVKYINIIRRRAAWPGMESQMEVSESELNIDFLLDEKSRELFGEQRRWHDLKRTGKLLERVKLYNPVAAENIKEHHALRPIPMNQIQRSTNEYGQNPGY